MNINRLEVLQRVQRKELSIEEGSRLLGDLEHSPDGQTEAASEPVQTEASKLESAELVDSSEPLEEPWQQWKWLPFGLAVTLTAVAAYWLFASWQKGQYGLAFWLSWIPFVLGAAGMALSWQLRWLHLRVSSNTAGRPNLIVLHLPLPLNLAAWGLRGYLRTSSSTSDQQTQMIAEMLAEAARSREPLQILVDADGSTVEICVS